MNTWKYIPLLVILVLLMDPTSSTAQKKNENKKNPVDTCAGKGTAIQSLGASTHVMLYNSFLAISSIVDGHIRGVYEDDLALSLLNDQLAMINLVDTNYAKLLQSGFIGGSEDRKEIEGARDVLSALYLYANSYKLYIGDKSPVRKEQFTTAQDAAWEKLKAQLGL